MKNLEITIKTQKDIIERAKKEFYTARNKFDRTVDPIVHKQKQILNKFICIINEKIKEEHNCDCCNPMLYDEAQFTDKGISLFSNDRGSGYWLWNEVEQILTKNE